MDSKTCCVTGHRDIPASKADGSDSLFAAIVAEEKQRNPALFLEAAIPYRGRMQTPNREFQRLLLVCDQVTVIRESYIPSCYMERNRYMVDHSQRVIAVYDGRKYGGTFSTIRYASAIGRDVRAIWIR